MASASFAILQLAVAVTTCQASTAAQLLPQSSVEEVKGFFADTRLDVAFRDAFAEGVLALAVFGAASFLMRSLSKRAPKKASTSKVKCVATGKKSSQARISSCSKVEDSGIQGDSTQGNARPTHAKKDSAKIPEADAIANAVRAGKAFKLPELLDAALARAVHNGTAAEEELASQLLLTALRACAASHSFREALVAFDHISPRIGGGNANLWSVLLYVAVEASELHRCAEIFDQLCSHAKPSGHDFVNMVRCYIDRQDHKGLTQMLSTLSRANYVIDVYTMNRALAACASSDSVLDLSEALSCANLCAEGLDAVGFNTLMKYNARVGRISRCFELRDQMLAQGLQASEVTFGILLDACVSAQELDRAREVFEDLCSSGLQLNVVHCTSFMKVLLSARRLDEAAEVLREMVRSPGVKPDLITYSTLVKAYSGDGKVASALSILELMISQGIKGDEIIFNSVLTSCSTFPLKPTNVMRTFEVLISHGLKPSTATLSILLKGLAHSDSWGLSLEVLELAPKRFGVQPEPRLYAQLVQSCVKARSTDIVISTFEAMLQTSRRQGKKADAVAVGRCLRSCVLAGEAALTSQLWDVVEKDGIKVEACIEKSVRGFLAKKMQGVRLSV